MNENKPSTGSPVRWVPALRWSRSFDRTHRGADLGVDCSTTPRVLVLDCRAIPDLEYTALKMLTEGERRLQQSGIRLWLAGVIQKSTLGQRVGRAGMYFNLDQGGEELSEAIGGSPPCRH